MLAPIVVPFVRDELDSRTVAALEPYGSRVEYVDVGGDIGAYWSLFSEMWRRGGDWILVEHDIEVTPRVTIERFDSCPEPWCTSPYWWQWQPGYPESRKPGERVWRDVGCVRYRAELMAAAPELSSAEKMRARWPELPEVVRWDWVAGLQGLALASHGRQPHVHDQVAHHQRLAEPSQ
jgi:hypothetical protein